MTIQEIRDNGYSIENIKIKTYLPINEKEELIRKIVSFATDDVGNTKRINFIIKEFAFEFFMTINYADIELMEDKDIVAIYDELKEYGFINSVLRCIEYDEYEFIKKVVENELKQVIDEQNSIGTVLDKALTEITSKLPSSRQLNKIIKEIPKLVNEIDNEKLKAIGWANKDMKK